MKRFDTVNWIDGGNVIDYELPIIEFDESLTDTSHFIPTAEAVKRLANAPALSGDQVAQAYDFIDGRDNGMNIPIGRNPGKDIAEISVDIRNKQSEIASQLKEGEKNFNIAKAVDAAMNSVSNPSVVSSNGNS